MAARRNGSRQKHGAGLNGAAPEPQQPVCFVMMPITDPAHYAPKHFQRVFEDIFVPACQQAGYKAVRADQVRQTNLIHVDVLHRVINSPMALCDLSSRNPNVLFELGLRVAFDRPVLLVRDVMTEDLFDIAPLRYTEYRRERIYHEVLEDQRRIAMALKDTHLAEGGAECANSVIRLLALPQAAQYAEPPRDPQSALLHQVSQELQSLRSEVRNLRERLTEVGREAAERVC